MERYISWVDRESDPRVNSWFLMSSPLPTVLILASYLALAAILKIYMRNLKAVNIRWMIWGFDFFHLATSSTLIFIIIKLKLLINFNFR